MKQENDVSNVLLNYLRDSYITIDEKDFVFQLKTHPKYPQLVSIADTLESFNIDFNIYETSIDEIEPGLDTYAALLKDDRNQSSLFLIKRKKGTYISNSEKLSEAALKEAWLDIILVIEKGKPLVPVLKKGFAAVLLLSLAGVLLTTLAFFDFAFLLVILSGFFFSLLALKIDLEIDSPFAKKVCDLAAKGNCESIIKSKQWGLFKIVNLSELGFSFFVSQMLLFLFSAVYNSLENFYSFQYLLLITSSVVVILSLFYQKFIVKKWCAFCLGVITVLLLEFVLIQTSDYSLVYDIKFLVTALAVFLAVFLACKKYKKLLSENKSLINTSIHTNHLLNHYSTFKAILKSEKPVGFYTDSLSAISKKKLVLTLVTDPFCEHCKNLHFELISALQDIDSNAYCLKIIFNIDTDEEDEDEIVYLTMIGLQQTKGNRFFFEEFSEWYHDKNTKKWLERHYDPAFGQEKNELIKQSLWCRENGINYTPALFLNQYKLPGIYEVSRLKYFFDELIEDPL